MARLFLTRLVLGHFRSHRATRLAFDGRSVVLTGPNGAGKTNVLEAISLLSPGRGMRGASAEDIMRRPEAIGWKVAAELDTPEGPQQIETQSEGAGRGVRLNAKAAPQTALARVAPMLWLTPAMDRLWIEPPEGRRRFLDRLTLTLVPDHATAATAYERALRERNHLLRDGVSDPGWLGAIEARMAAAGARMGANRRTALARILAAQGAGGFPQAQAQIVPPEPLPEAEADLAALWQAGRRRDLAAGRTLVGPHRIDLVARHAAKDMAAQDCSTGEQKALLISLLLANAAALAQAQGAPPLLLLDEVAAHLDETRRGALHDALLALGVQAFLTGTDTQPFAPWQATAQHLALHDASGQTEIAS
jgi:DNA replication and repair protein RecF